MAECEPEALESILAQSPIVWRPSDAYIAKSRLRRFIENNGCASLDELQRRAIGDVAWFWNAVVADLGLEFYRLPDRVVDLSRGLPWPDWFVGGRYNYVHNAVDKHARSPRRNQLALIWEGEDGDVRKLSYWELFVEVNCLAAALRGLGIEKGDRVGIFMPMVPEVAIAMLACSKIGAIFTPIFSGFAAPAVAVRLNDCGAKLLVTANGFYRRGQVIPMKETADGAATLSPTIEHVLVYRRLDRGNLPWTEGRDIWWHDLIAGQPRDLPTFETSAADPYMIIYTSGTTGRPKGALHTHCGFPIKASQDLAHCFDLQEGDVLFWLTDMGWMMGPWAVVGGLTLGAPCLLYEGTPDFPEPDRLWAIVERHGITHLGLSPTVIRALMARDADWVHRHDLSTLRVLGSTGEPWSPPSWRWFFEEVGGGRCPIINYSGGTEISGGIVGCTTLQPLKPCCFSGPVVGMDADVVDDAGRPVRGQVGELVIRGPWVGMTHGFWNDSDRYLEAYWNRLPDVWVHGDWALIDADGFWYILGRSDDTLKVAGKRVGPAEVESAAATHGAVQEAAAVGVPDAVKGEAIVVFCMLKPGIERSAFLADEIRAAVAHDLGHALRPAAVEFVADFPRTRNAKILRRVIRAAYVGSQDLGDLSALENRSALEAIAVLGVERRAGATTESR